MKTKIWARILFGFFTCVTMVSAKVEDHAEKLKNNWPWKKWAFYVDPDTNKSISQQEAVKLGAKRVRELKLTDNEYYDLLKYITNRDGFLDNGMFSSIQEAIKHTKTTEGDTPATHTNVSQIVQPQDFPTVQPQDFPTVQPQDFPPQDFPTVQPQGIIPTVQPQRIQPKKKLFGDVIKDKNHHDLLANKMGNGSLTYIPTLFLYQMLETIGFDPRYIQESIDLDDLKKRLINHYGLHDIRKVLSDVQNAGYTAHDDGCEVVFGLIHLLEETVKMYENSLVQNINKKENDVEHKDDSLMSIPEHTAKKVLTAEDAAYLRKNIFVTKLLGKDRRDFQKKVRATAKKNGVKEKLVLNAYSVLMNPKAKDTAIEKLDSDAVQVLIESYSLFLLDKKGANVKEALKDTRIGKKELEKLTDSVERKMSIVQNAVDYGVEINEDTTYAMMSMFGLGDTKADRDIREAVSKSIDSNSLTETAKNDDDKNFITTYLSNIQEQLEGLSGKKVRDLMEIIDAAIKEIAAK